MVENVSLESQRTSRFSKKKYFTTNFMSRLNHVIAVTRTERFNEQVAITLWGLTPLLSDPPRTESASSNHQFEEPSLIEQADSSWTNCFSWFMPRCQWKRPKNIWISFGSLKGSHLYLKRSFYFCFLLCVCVC